MLPQDGITLIGSEFSVFSIGIVMFMTCLDKVILTSRALVLTASPVRGTNRLKISANMLSTPLICSKKLKFSIESFQFNTFLESFFHEYQIVMICSKCKLYSNIDPPTYVEHNLFYKLFSMVDHLHWTGINVLQRNRMGCSIASGEFCYLLI